MNYQDLTQKAKELHQEAHAIEILAEEAKTDEIKKQGIKGWLEYTFESSSGLTEEFARFSRDMKKELKKIMIDYELVNYSRGHFYYSVFFKNIKNDKLVYISSSDVRYFQDNWYNNLLIRTAEHEKDYTGGFNDWATLPKLKEKADYLTR